MRKYFPYTIIFLAIISSIIGIHFLGSNAEINLTAPSTYEVGDLITLDATESVAEQLQWTILPKTKNFKIVGKTAYFSSSAPDRYTVIITATNNGTLATKVIFLEPGTNDPLKIDSLVESEIAPLPIDPKVQKLAMLIDGKIINTLDTAVLVAKQLNLEIPDFKTFKEFEKWIVDNS